MRRGSWAIACLIGALAVAGCGKQSHPNDPRPAVATEVTVAISESDVNVSPSKVGTPGSGAQITQNEGQKERKTSSDVPLTIAFTVSNQTTAKTKLEITGPRDYTSNVLIANGSGNFKASLPTGTYRVRASGVPGAAPGQLVIGPSRSASSNQLLLP